MKTAVEFLKERYNQMNGKLSDEDFEKAKAMEKEQLYDAWIDGNVTECSIDKVSASINFEDYFNEAFKQEEQ